jgi:hypothetical protein
MSERLPETAHIQWLSRAIAAEPDAPVNYLLRGEEWLALGAWAQARQDFLVARMRAEALLAEAAWGYSYQSYIDRACVGLRQCDAVR